MPAVPKSMSTETVFAANTGITQPKHNNSPAVTSFLGFIIFLLICLRLSIQLAGSRTVTDGAKPTRSASFPDSDCGPGGRRNNTHPAILGVYVGRQIGCTRRRPSYTTWRDSSQADGFWYLHPTPGIVPGQMKIDRDGLPIPPVSSQRNG